jgi:two-component system, sensor histidine kinase and response regulator
MDADFLSVLKTAFHAGEPFHLCIVNIPMPGASGYDVAKVVRQDVSPVSSLPLLACSCAVEPGHRRSMEAGFSGFLPMPARRKNLVEAVAELLAGRRGGITAPREERNVGADLGEVERTRREVRILLAEDNPANQRLARLILLKEGYEVEVASNGTEVVKMFTSQPDRYHVILMDVQMPEMDGMAAAKAIRAKGFDRIPIIAMTANAMKGDREKCLEAGMNDYFPKPIRREAVSKIVEKWAATEDRG